MTRIRLIVALLISIIFIGGAGWFRFTRMTKITKGLATKDPSEERGSFDHNFPNTDTVSGVTSEPLSQTDVVSRKLFSDYISLTSNGPAGAEDVNKLAEKYATEILRQVSSTEIGMGQIKTIADSRTNLSLYSQNVTSIRNDNKNLIEKLYSESGATNDINNPSFKIFMEEVGKLYNSAAQTLLALEVPASLAENHRALINNYLSSSLVMKMFGNVSKDPVGAYAAMNTQVKNAEEESQILSNIQNTLIASGIIFEYNI